MLRRDNWSHWEDESIMEVVLEFAKQKKTIGQAFQHLAVVLPNRTEKAVSAQWYNNLRGKLFKATEAEELETVTEEAVGTPLSLEAYVSLLGTPNLTQETIELINLRIRSLI